MENSNQTPRSASRRDFFKETARKAAWVAPTVTLMLAASATPARAAKTSGQHDYSSKNQVNGFQFWKVWYRVHRGRSM